MRLADVFCAARIYFCDFSYTLSLCMIKIVTAEIKYLFLSESLIKINHRMQVDHGWWLISQEAIKEGFSSTVAVLWLVQYNDGCFIVVHARCSWLWSVFSIEVRLI
jgi:hypothetical protein